MLYEVYVLTVPESQSNIYIYMRFNEQRNLHDYLGQLSKCVKCHARTSGFFAGAEELRCAYEILFAKNTAGWFRVLRVAEP